MSTSLSDINTLKFIAFIEPVHTNKNLQKAKKRKKIKMTISRRKTTHGFSHRCTKERIAQLALKPAW